MAAECGAAVFEVTAASIVGAYVGESERRLREAFEAARAAARVAGAPCIVFLDEVDALCPARGSAGGHEARIVAQLLTLLDGASEPGARCGVATRCMPLGRRTGVTGAAVQAGRHRCDQPAERG